ncbi:hypothetical protein QG37_05182 [Candidozyma auris]|nr:hypothetical protein QG37_05182 [[Candida] auris]
MFVVIFFFFFSFFFFYIYTDNMSRGRFQVNDKSLICFMEYSTYPLKMSAIFGCNSPDGSDDHQETARRFRFVAIT